MNVNQQAQKLLELVNKNNKEKYSKFVSVASGKGGVGKTNFAVNFSYVLANKFDKKVLLIDADVRMADVHVILNLKPQNSIKSLIEGKKPEDIVLSAKGFDILPGLSGLDSLDTFEDYLINKVITDLAEFSQNYDFIVIDTAAGVDNKVTSFVRASSKSYIITTPEPTAIMDAYALMKSIYKIYDYADFKLVVNMCKNKNEAINTYERLNNSAKRFLNKNIDSPGWLPFSENVKKAIKQKKLVAEEYPSDPFTKAIIEIAAKEVGEEVKVEKENFWNKLMGFLKK